MALEESGNGLFMPVAPAYSAGGNGNGNGFGGDWAWIILLLLLGWGNNGFGGGNGGGYGGGNVLYPWMNQADITTTGFQNQLLNDNITSVRDGIFSLSNQLCGCCGDIQMSLANGFAGIEQGANARQIANMQQAFAAQTAMSQGFNGLQAQLAQCCCDNRAATQDLKFTLAQEECATRANSTQNTQAILDKLCQLELDGYKRENDSLRSQLTAANLAASQTAQTSELRTAAATIANQAIAEMRACPIPSQPVYGNQPIFTCNQNQGCGCGCGSF